MSSFGSGRVRGSAKALVEQCDQLDINLLMRQSDVPMGTPLIQLSAPKTFQLTLAWTDCHYGGQRPWFLCPLCQKRSGKLYAPSPSQDYRCRHCWGLTYKSCQQSGNSLHQAVSRLKRTKHKLRVPAEQLAPIYPCWCIAKPKGMRWKTYERLGEECRAADRSVSLAINGSLATISRFLESKAITRMRLPSVKQSHY